MTKLHVRYNITYNALDENVKEQTDNRKLNFKMKEKFESLKEFHDELEWKFEKVQSDIHNVKMKLGNEIKFMTELISKIKAARTSLHLKKKTGNIDSLAAACENYVRGRGISIPVTWKERHMDFSIRMYRNLIE